MRAVACQDFTAGFGYEDVVLDSHTELAGDIDARLDCDYLARFERALAVGFEEWRFVDFQAEAVARAVAVNG